MTKQDFITDEMIDAECARLTASEAVKLARRELRLRYKRRQALYTLRNLEKRGKELLAAGITIENIDEMLDSMNRIDFSKKLKIIDNIGNE